MRIIVLGIGKPGAWAHVTKGRKCRRRLYGLPEARQTGISSPPSGPWRYPLRTVTPRFGSRNSMNSFELNKILGAVLGTCLILLALNIGAGALFAPEKPAKPGFDIAVKEESAGEKAGAAKGAGAADRNPSREGINRKGTGDRQTVRRLPHLRKGGPNRVGPNLWNIVGSDRGEGRGGFNFSAAMKAKGGKWTFDELNKFLANPRQYIPGTAMTFAGISKARTARRCDRLSAHVVGQSGSAAKGCGKRAGRREQPKK